MHSKDTTDGWGERFTETLKVHYTSDFIEKVNFAPILLFIFQELTTAHKKGYEKGRKEAHEENKVDVLMAYENGLELGKARAIEEARREVVEWAEKEIVDHEKGMELCKSSDNITLAVSHHGSVGALKRIVTFLSTLEEKK